MKVLGIISEYNPLHLGHIYHINKSKEITKSDAVIAIMSGSFLQRGEPAIIDKWSRSKMAINSGVDLVIELPFIYSSQTAERFASGAIRTLDSLNIIDSISFGIEDNSIKELERIVEVLHFKPESYQKLFKSYLKKGYNFIQARTYALEDYLKRSNLKSKLNSSNNILAIEYLLVLKKINSNIKPVGVPRKGSKYNDKFIKSEEYASATALRKAILENNFEPVKNNMSNYNYRVLEDFLLSFKKPNTIYDMEDLIFYKLNLEDEKSINKFVGTENGLGNRILNNLPKSKNLKELINKSISKTHTETRVKRTLIHILTDFNKKTAELLDLTYPSHIRILGFNEVGAKLIKKISNNSDLVIVNKFSNHIYNADKNIRKILELENRVTNLYFNSFEDKLINLDYLTSPYINIKR